jgi:hypothetical protein
MPCTRASFGDLCCLSRHAREREGNIREHLTPSLPRKGSDVDTAIAELQIWLSAEQRLDRAHTGELRRGGLAVVLERAIPAPEESRCLFAVVAAMKRVVARSAELAQLSPVGIAEARG